MNASRRYALTPKETQVMELLREHTVSEVSYQLDLSIAEVEETRKTALRKRRWFRSSVAPGKI